MKRELLSVGWNNIPKYLIDEAEELLRLAMGEEGLCFMIQQDECYGVFDKSLATTTAVDWDWNDLSRMGLLVYLNANVFHPHNYAVMRTPDTGHSSGALVENEPWSFPSEVYVESMNAMLACGIVVEGWNIDWSDH